MSYKFFMDSTNLIQSIKNKIWRQKETVSQMTRMFMEVSYVRASPQHPHRTLRSRKHDWRRKSLPQARGEVGEKQLSLQLILGAFQVPNKQESVRYHSPADSDWRQQPVTAEDLFTGFLFMFVCIHWKSETDSNITHGLKKTSYLSLVLKNKTENRKHKKRISPLFYILSIVFFFWHFCFSSSANNLKCIRTKIPASDSIFSIAK